MKTHRLFICILILLSPAATIAADERFDVTETSVAKIHDAIQAGRLTSRQLVQLYLDRIAAYDQKGPAINCIISLNTEAIADAEKLDAVYAKTGRFAGPLHGIPILVKDEVDVAKMVTTQGTVMFKDYLTPLDSFPIARLRAAGAIILGKTTLSEFAGGDTYGTLFGASKNPYALDRTVGGSSGGSGGALAANFSTLAVGEETSSSLRRPAAWGALVGMRPTPGLVSRSGMWDGHPVPTAQMGPMALNVSDMAKMLDGMVGYDPEDPITALGIMHTPKTYTSFLDKNGLRGARIGIIRQILSPNSEPKSDDFIQVDEVYNRAVAEMAAAGATVVDVTIPDLKELTSKRTTDPTLTTEALRVYLARNPTSQFRNQADIDAHPEMPNSFKVRSGWGRGRNAAAKQPDAAEILESNRAREQLMINIAQVMADNRLDALAYKAVEHQPPLIAEAVNPPYTRTRGVVSLNTFLIHASTITVPMGFTRDNLPAGLAFLGLPFSEPTLIKFAYAYEQATHHRRPPATTPPLAKR